MTTTTLDEIYTENKTEEKKGDDYIQKALDKKKHIQNFIKQMVVFEKELSEIRESRKDIIKDYIDNNYLDKEEVKKTKQAISLAKKLKKLEDLDEYFSEATKIV